jgi:Holliday junction resolvasome RuvABC endonuclease subunit
MQNIHPKEKRILAIDPISRGFGFAILEGSEKLIDWGMKQVTEQKESRCVEQCQKIIEHYYPDIIVVENCKIKGSRRCARIRKLLNIICEMAAKMHISSRRFTREKIRQVFPHHEVRTKRQIAIAVALKFPALRPRLPKSRKFWMREDERMSIFDSVALALTYYHFSGRPKHKPLANQ